MMQPGTTGSVNYIWAQTAAAVIANAGIHYVCISPGSRNSPLTLAFTEQAELTCFSHIDERSAGFFALGLARSRQEPVVLICTSGTAAANYLPAVVEANQDRIPLIILTADRPEYLVGTGANQTIRQQDLYGYQVRSYRDTGLPEESTGDLEQFMVSAVLSSLGRTGEGIQMSPPGPVHVNFPFDEPLLPESIDNFPSIELKLKPGYTQSYLCTDLIPLHGRQPLIVAGRLQSLVDRDAILRLGKSTGIPVLADSLSQLRYHSDSESVLCGYDHFIPFLDMVPDQVIRFGAKPTSKILCQKLDEWKEITTLIDSCGRYNDDCPNVIQCSIPVYCEFLQQADLPVEEAWKEHLSMLESMTQLCIKEKMMDRPDSEAALIQFAIAELNDGTNLIMSNSMPVRQLDIVGIRSEASLHGYANRGASGIDGMVSTALGIAADSSHSMNLLIIGDLSFYHDLNGLLAANRYDITLTILLLNNNGGGIFNLLPVKKLEPVGFTEFWTTPHAMDFSDAARFYGCLYKRLERGKDLPESIRESFRVPGVKIIEAATKTEDNLILKSSISADLKDRLNSSRG